MADIQRLSQALKAAHAAGDTAAAQKLAQAIRNAQQASVKPRNFSGVETSNQDDGKDRSFGSAFAQGIDAPLENLATTARAVGYGGTADFLSGLTDAPQNYESASAQFINRDGEGYQFGYLPRAAVEQAGQFAGSLATRAAGAGAGAAIGSLVPGAGTVGGAAVGGFAGPAIFEGLQLLGPIALERAKNNGRETPNKEDWIGAIATSTASGSLNAIAPGLSGFLKRVVVETGTEGLQSIVQQTGETAATDAGLDVNLKQAGGEGIIGGVSVGVVDAPIAATRLFNKKGDFDPSALTNQEKLAGADVARILQSVVQENGYNLKDLDVSSEKGAKKALEAVRRKIISRIDEITKNKEIKKYFNSTTAKSLGDIDLYAEANGGIKAAKNKVADRVTQSQINAIRRLMPPTQEAQELLNLMAMSNVTTDLFNRGMKGGISRYTDYFNPLIKDGSYDPSRMANIAVGTGSALTLGPTATAGIVAGGRAVDAITGRRAVLDRFLKKNVNKEGLANPGGPSLLALKELQKKLEQQQLDASKQETLELNRALYDEGIEPAGLDGTMDKASPEAQMMLALEVNTPDGRFGPDRTTINSAVQSIIDNPDSPKALVKAAETYLTNIRDGGKIPKLTPLIQAVKREINSNPEVYGRTRASQLSQGPAFAPTVAQPAQPAQQEQSPAYQAGIQRNIDRVDIQQAVVRNRPDIPDTEKTAMLEALDRLKQPLTNPVVAVQYEMTQLMNQGVNESMVQAAFAPILEAVTSQQRQAQGLQTPTENTQRPALETNAPTPPQALSEAPAQPALQLTPEMRQGLQKPTPEAVLEILQRNPYRQQQPTNEDDTKFDMEPPAIPALSSDRLTMNFTDVTKRTPELQEGQRKLKSGEITREDYADLVNKFKPVLPYQTAPAPATVQDATYALANGRGQSDKKAAKYGEPTKVLQPGQRIQVRLDIPSYSQHGTWVISVHEPNSRPDSTAEGRFKAGPVIGYESAIAIRNAELGMLQLPAQKIAEGSPKGTIATMLGEYLPMSPSEAQAYQQNAIEQSLQPGSGFAQVGMDPERHSYFYDRNTMQPIVAAEEIVQVGPLVIVKNPQYAPTDDFVFDQEPPALQMPEIVRGETTNIMMPNDLGSAFTFARDNNFRTGRDLKLQLQQRSLDRQKEEGIDLTQVNEENVPRLADHVFNDAIEALKNNENAIGWYDRTVTKALETLGEIYPEILTNPENKLQFIWALAVTSNGTKVDKNFELAADAYDHLQRTGVFPTDIGIGTAAKAINGGLAQYHTMLTKFQGNHQALADFMIGQLPVRDVEQQYGVKISGEGKDTLVRGASVLGPKIGNGFFANLYGHFDALTMDRWLMRTVGRMRGSLVKVNRPMVKQKQSEMGDIISNASPDQLKQLRSYLKPSGIPVTKNMSMQQKNDLAAYIARQSTDKSWREGLNNISNDMRLVGNALALYLDGQVEAPAGAKERTFIRDVFKQALDRLNNDPRVSRVSNAGLTMSDLQALLWYPEKRLYDTAKAPAGEESRGYSDDEAPDYANAARKLVEARKAMVVGSGLGPSSGDGPRGRGPALADAGRTVDDREPGLLPALREGRGKLGAKFSRRPQRQEVVDQFPPVKALFEIGKKGSPYENGITNLDQALALARALNITVQLYLHQSQMMAAQGRKNTGAVRGSFRKKPNGASGTVFALREHARIGNKNTDRISSLDELTTVLHEIFHGVTMGPMSGEGPMLNGNGNGTNSVENAIGSMIEKPQGKRTREEREIIYEVKRLQDQLDVYIEGNPSERRSVRVLNKALQDLEENRMRMTPEQQMQQEQAIDNYKNYIRSKAEFAVDPFWVYAVNPKLAKQVMPVTTKWIQKNLRKAGNKDIQFYSHPFAVSVAVMLAILAAEGGEQEEQEQQQPGALSPMPGMLTAA